MLHYKSSRSRGLLFMCEDISLQKVSEQQAGKKERLHLSLVLD